MEAIKIKKNIREISLYTKFAFNAILIGGVLLSITFFMSIGYYPSGLSLSEVLFFVITLISFGAVYLLITLGLFTGGIVLTPFLRWTQNGLLYLLSKYSNIERVEFRINFRKLTVDYIGLATGGVIVLLFVISLIPSDPNKGLELILSMVLMSFFYGLWYTKPKNESNERVINVIPPFLVATIRRISCCF